MKNILIILACIANSFIQAQTSIVFKPATGDAEMDKNLVEVNSKALNDISTFKNEINNEFSIAKNKIDEMLKIMAPGDVFMAAQVAQVTQKPIEQVSEVYTKNKSKGWGSVAKELGIKPGSKEFHALKGKTKKGKVPEGKKGKSENKGNGKSKGKK
jgi:hypothetical protein